MRSRGRRGRWPPALLGQDPLELGQLLEHVPGDRVVEVDVVTSGATAPPRGTRRS